MQQPLHTDVIKIHGMRKIHGAFQKTLPIKRYVVMAETPLPKKNTRNG